MIASIIAAGASLAANAINNHRMMRNFYENRNYNTPASQMSRFRQAGLNPHLIYTQTNESAPPPNTNPADLSSLGNAATELSEYQNIKKSKAEVSNLEKTNEQIDAQIVSTYLDNELKQKEINWYDVKTSADVNLVQEQANVAKKTIEQMDKNIENIVANTAKLKRETKKIDFDQFIETFNAILANKQFQLDCDKLGLEKEKFEESIRQFNENNWQKDLLYQFFNGLSENGIRDFAKQFGVTIKSYLFGAQDSTNNGASTNRSNWYKNVKKWRNSH